MSNRAPPGGGVGLPIVWYEPVEGSSNAVALLMGPESFFQPHFFLPLISRKRSFVANSDIKSSAIATSFWPQIIITLSILHKFPRSGMWHLLLFVVR